MRNPAAQPEWRSPARSDAELRLLSRLSAAFLLDLVAAVRGDRSLLDSLLLTAISQANVAEINRRADLQTAYADAQDAPADELRRPVTMHAVANSLGQPFETVRRHVKRMAAADLVEFRDGGVIVPARVVTAPEYYANALRAYERTRAFYYQLSDLDLLPELPAPSVSLAPGVFPLRVMARLVADYVLRALETMVALTGDLVDAVILLDILRANTEALPAAPTAGEDLEAEGPLADAARTPVRVSELARRLDLPPETVRRRVASLVAHGQALQSGRGVIVPAATLGGEAFGRVMAANAASLKRLFVGLAQLGVLAIWEELRASPTRGP